MFTSITEGFYDYESGQDYGNKMYHYWCDPLEAQKLHKLKGKFYQWRSEVMYFNKQAKEFFTLAKKVYNNPLVNVKQFAGHTPDELAINIAASKLGIEPLVVPVRGGTDGARLSYMGLPCPNICTGGHNFHGKFEYIPVQSMEKTVEILLEVVSSYSNWKA